MLFRMVRDGMVDDRHPNVANHAQAIDASISVTRCTALIDLDTGAPLRNRSRARWRR